MEGGVETAVFISLNLCAFGATGGLQATHSLTSIVIDQQGDSTTLSK